MKAALPIRLHARTEVRRKPAEKNQELLPLLEDELAIVTLEAEYNSPSCTSFSALKSENRQLKNQVKSLQNRLKEKRKNLRKTRSQGVY